MSELIQRFRMTQEMLDALNAGDRLALRDPGFGPDGTNGQIIVLPPREVRGTEDRALQPLKWRSSE